MTALHILCFGKCVWKKGNSDSDERMNLLDRFPKNFRIGSNKLSLWRARIYRSRMALVSLD